VIIEKERREINGVTNCGGKNNTGKQRRIFQNQKFFERVVSHIVLVGYAT
jgi:hypothetical protein